MKITRNLLPVMIISIFLSGCNRNTNVEMPKEFYCMDGYTCSSIDAMVRHNIHIAKMRNIQLDINFAKGIISEYEYELKKIDYKRLHDIYDAILRTNYELNHLFIKYGANVKNTDTLIAKNGMIFFVDKNKGGKEEKEIINTLNNILFSLDSLDKVNNVSF